MPLRALTFGLGTLAVFTLFWVMWPSPFKPSYWDEPAPPPLTGALAPNTDLDQARRYSVGEAGTANGLLTAPDGSLYFGTPDGHIHRFLPGRPENPVQEIARVTDAPIYGLDWASETRIAVASLSGLYAVDLINGSVARLSTGIASHAFGYVNDLTVAADGTIYFTDSSARWQASDEHERYFREMLENRPTGSIYAWDPRLQQSRLVVDGLYYPNGILLAPDGRSLYFSETFRHRVMRLWLTGPSAGQVEPVATNLPGYPDSLSWSRDGEIMVAMLASRITFLRHMHRYPLLAELYAKLPTWMRPEVGRNDGFIALLDPADGQILRTLRSSDERFCLISDTTTGPMGSLWFSSIECGYIARLPGQARVPMDRPDIGQPVSAPIDIDADTQN